MNISLGHIISVDARISHAVCLLVIITIVTIIIIIICVPQTVCLLRSAVGYLNWSIESRFANTFQWRDHMARNQYLIEAKKYGKNIQNV